jgi:hypothetical protein
LLKSFGILGLLVSVVGIVGCGGSGESSAEVIAPDGAPYSYTVPAGFENVGHPRFPGGGVKFLTLAVPSGSTREGYVGAFEWPLGATERGYSTQRLLSWLDEQTQSFYRGEGATLSAGMDTKVAGQDAVCWKIHHFKNESEGLVEADSCAIVANHKVVSQSCSWKPTTRAAIQRGCEELRASLKF